jgi:chromosome segregation ATPase
METTPLSSPAASNFFNSLLEEMIVQQQTCAKSMSEAALRYQQLVSDAKVFTDVSSSLRTMLQALDTQRTQLQASLEALARLVISASAGLPKIEEKILEMTKQIESGVRATNDQWSAMAKAITQSVQTSISELKQLLSDTVKAANQELNSHVKQMAEQTKQQVVTLDAALSTELTKSIESLGRQLTALSQKFVEDYLPLTEKLRQIVQMTRAV